MPSFLFDAEKDPPTMLPHEAKKICSLDLGVTEPVVVYDFDGAIITGLLAPKEVWKERLKKLAKFHSYIARLSWARENEKKRKRFEYLFSIARGPFAGWKLGQKYVFENKNGRVVYMKKTPRQFAKWKRTVGKTLRRRVRKVFEVGRPPTPDGGGFSRKQLRRHRCAKDQLSRV